MVSIWCRCLDIETWKLRTMVTSLSIIFLLNLNPHAGSSLPRSYLPHVAIWVTCKKETKTSERIPKTDMVISKLTTAFINGGDSPIWLWWWWISSERICTPIELCAFFLKARIAFSFSLLNTPQWKCWQRGANMFSWGLPCVRNLLGNCDSCKSSRVLTVGLLCSARQNKMKCSIYWSMTRQFVIVSIQSFGFQRLLQQQKDDVVTQSPRFTPHRWQLVGPGANPSSYLLLGNPSSSRYHPCRSLRLFEQRHEMAWR